MTQTQIDIPEQVTNWQILGRLIMAPLMGAAYVVFLPTVGFYLVFKFAGEKLWNSHLVKLCRRCAISVV